MNKLLAIALASILVSSCAILLVAFRERPKPPPPGTGEVPQVVEARPLPIVAPTPSPAVIPLPEPPPPGEVPPPVETPIEEAKRILQEIGNPSKPIAMKTAADLLDLIPGMPNAASLSAEQILAIEEAMDDAKRNSKEGDNKIEAAIIQMANEADARNDWTEEQDGRDQKVNIAGASRIIFSREVAGRRRTYTFLEQDYPEIFEEKREARSKVSEQLLRDAIAAVRERQGDEAK